MSNIMQLEVRRLWHNKGPITACLTINLLLCMIATQLLGSTTSTLIWALIPMFALAANGCYRDYIQPQWVILVREHPNKGFIMRLGFALISVSLNMPLALVLTISLSATPYLFILLWCVLDIVGFLLHCIKTLSYQATGILVCYLFMMPLVYPWVLLGELAATDNIAAFKLLLSAWVLLYTLGVFFYNLCFNIGEGSV